MVHFRLMRLIAQPWGILAATAAGLALSGLSITQALTSAAIFSGLIGGAPVSALTGAFVALAASLLLRPAASAGRELIAHAVAGRMKRSLRGRLLDHDAALGPFATGDERVAARNALLTDGVENLEPYATRYIPQLAVTALTATVTTALLISIDPVVGVVTGVIALLVPLVPRLWDRALRGRGEEHWDAYSDMHAGVVDAMRGMETLKLLGADRRRRADLASASSTLLRTTLRQLRLSLAESGITGFLLVAGPAIALSLGALRVSVDALEPAALFTVTLIAFELFRPFRDLANHWHAGYLGLTAGGHLITRLAGDIQHVASAHAPVFPPAGVAVSVDDVAVCYPGSDRPVLEHLSLRVHSGTVTAIVGPSGAGKSTIANLILGLLPAHTGQVQVARANGVPPVTLISQEPVLFAGTLRENLLLVAPSATDRELRDALARAQAAELADLRDGLDTQVGDGGSLLSGGQRQRVAIARAMLRGSPILLLDEASSALDARRERDLLDGLRGARIAGHPITVIVIAHRLAAVRDADRIIVIDDGRVVEAGRYEELVERGGHLARLHAAQAQRVDI